MTWPELEDAFARLDPDLLAMSTAALEQDPHPRVHLLRALLARPARWPVDPLAELAALDGAALGPAEASLRDGLRTLLTAGPAAAFPGLLEHARRWPDDELAAAATTLSGVQSGLPGAKQAVGDLAEDRALTCPGPRADASLAMFRQEAGRLDEADELAGRALAAEPRHGWAAHVLAHVRYETGEHAAGQAWLDGWRAEHRVLLYQEHLAWHSALHALGLGDVEDALRRFTADIGPAQLADAGSLLWRCRLVAPVLPATPDGGGPAWALPCPAEDLVGPVQPVLAALPAAFPVLCACLALAAAGDAEGLARAAERLEADPRPAYADLTAPVVRALLACLEQRWPDAVALLQPLLPDLPRVGGSNAQREVVEDTLIVALLASGRAGPARALLEHRLDRRPHAVDALLLTAARG